jgi:diguanylate cyclase (GGDEF)-like protein
MAMYDQAPVIAGGRLHAPALSDALIRWLSFCAVVLISRRLREASNVNAILNVHLLRARRIAANDPLTGIANRGTFVQAVAEAARKASPQQPAGIFFCDLDGFKQVNDTHGHTAGDAILQMASARIANAVRTDDVVGRLGGDEFGVLARHVHDAPEAARMAAQIERAFQHPFHSGEATHNIGITIGVSICPDDGTSPEALLRCADERMYGAKQAKRIGR